MTLSSFASRHRNWLFPLILFVVTLLAYHPAWHGEFLWDDYCVPHGPHDLDHYTLKGLDDIWFHPTHQYYPLTYTSCWVEYHIWGLNTTGFHVVNICLHAFNAILLWVALRRLKVPGAWLAAAIFALHPVNVETAAWISERKNTLSCFFYLCAMIAVLKFWLPEETTAHGTQPRERLKDWTFYWLAFALYVCALFSKTTTLPLPAVVLLLVWWKRSKITWQDVSPLLLFIVTGIATGLITHHMEQHLGAHGKDFEVSLLDRCLIAGRDVWFYLYKLVWPYPVIFVYPRWKIAPSPPVAWLALLAFIAVFVVLWLKRNSWGRQAFVALAYFVGMLVLMLGFFNIYFFLYSFVSDHFQYLACMGPFALVSAGAVILFRRLGKAGLVLGSVLAAILLAALGTRTWRQCYAYANIETLWRTTAIENPKAFLAHNNYGDVLWDKGQREAALAEYRIALKLHPDQGSYHNVGNTLLQMGRANEAVVYLQKAIEIAPADPIPYSDIGNLYLQKGQLDLAITYFQKALQMEPDIPMANYNLGNAYIQEGQLDLAIRYWQKAVEIEPDFDIAHNNLANAYLLKGQVALAVQHWKTALETKPDLESALVNLAWVLATCPQESIRDGTDAVELAQRATQLTGGTNPVVLRTLAAAYAENGQFSFAIAAARQAMQIAQNQHNPQMGTMIEQQLKFYQNGQPFRDTSMLSH